MKLETATFGCFALFAAAVAILLNSACGFQISAQGDGLMVVVHTWSINGSLLQQG